MFGLNALGAGFKAVKAGLENVIFNNAGSKKGPKSKFKLSRWANKTAKGRAKYGLKKSVVNARSTSGGQALTTRGAAKGSRISGESPRSRSRDLDA